jgi:hypothetical protein
MGDEVRGTTRLVSVSSTGGQANRSSSFFPAILANGRCIAFESKAGNLVPNDIKGPMTCPEGPKAPQDNDE